MYLKVTKHGIRLHKSKCPKNSCSEARAETLHYTLMAYLALDW